MSAHTPDNANKRLGDMTPAERRAAIKAACVRLEKEFARPEVQKALADALAKAGV